MNSGDGALGGHPFVVAHRGASADRPEHTIAAYELALQEGADGVECDVRLTRDGQLVRFHIPIITHPDVKMTCWGLDGEPVEHHMAPGSIYYLDTRKPHSVANLSPVDRVHLVVDAVVTPEVRDRIARSLDVRRMP